MCLRIIVIGPVLVESDALIWWSYQSSIFRDSEIHLFCLLYRIGTNCQNVYHTSTEGHTAFIHRLICIKTYVHVGLQKSDAGIWFLIFEVTYNKKQLERRSISRWHAYDGNISFSLRRRRVKYLRFTVQSQLSNTFPCGEFKLANLIAKPAMLLGLWLLLGLQPCGRARHWFGGYHSWRLVL